MLKLASALPFVVVVTKPMKFSPSPLPDGSQTALEKNSRVNVVAGVLLRLPATVVLPFNPNPPKDVLGDSP